MGKKKGSHLVPVKKMVTRNGKTYETTVLVNPNKMNTVEHGGNVDVPIEKWANIKTIEDFDACRKEIVETKDVATRDALKNEFVDFLRASGVHFDKCPTNVNVEYMRCLSKAKKMINRGQFVAKGNPEGHHKLQAPKLYKSRQEARALCKDFTSNFEGTREELHQLLKDNGVQWDECEHEGINHMRAMMELREMLEEGKDVPFMNDFQKDNPNYGKQQKILDKKRLATHGEMYIPQKEAKMKILGLNSTYVLEYGQVEVKEVKKAFNHESKDGSTHHVSGTMYEVSLSVGTLMPKGGKHQHELKIGLFGNEDEAHNTVLEYQQLLKDMYVKTKKEYDEAKKKGVKEVHNGYIHVKHTIQDLNDSVGVKSVEVKKMWTPNFTTFDGSYSGDGFQLYAEVLLDKPDLNGKTKKLIPMTSFALEEEADVKLAKLKTKFENLKEDLKADKALKEQNEKYEKEKQLHLQKFSKEHQDILDKFKKSIYSVQKITKHLHSLVDKHGTPKSIEIVYSELEKQHKYSDGVEDKIYALSVISHYEDGHASYTAFEGLGSTSTAEKRCKAVAKTLTKHFGNVVKNGGFKSVESIKQEVDDAKKAKENKNYENNSQQDKITTSIADLQYTDPKYKDHEFFENKYQEKNAELTDKEVKRVSEHGKEWIEFKTAEQFNLWENGSPKANHGHAKKWWKKLKAKAREYIQAYTTENHFSYKVMNKLLRGGLLEEDGEFMKEVQDACDTITESINEYDLKDNITVYRGVNTIGFLESLGYNTKGKSHAELNELKNNITDDDMLKLKGGMYIDNAFLSSSVTKAGMFNKQCIITIRVPKGKGRLGYISGYSKVGTSEEELLLNSNSQIYIHDVKKNPYGKFELFCELIPKEDTKRLDELAPKQHTSEWLNTEEGKKHKKG